VRHRHRPQLTRHAGTAVTFALLTVGMAACTSSQAPQAVGPPDRPARVVATQTLSPRVRDLTIDSPALGRSAKVRLLLPRRFQAQPNRRWPVLWLLHGCCDTYQSWTRSTDVEELAGLADVLVVMPEAGPVGFYSDWYNGGQVGPPRWETFHLTELWQLLERDWRAGKRRVVAGLSMGGLGAMAYAARHPGMFRAAASYSGLLHIRYQGDPLPGPRMIQDLLRNFDEDPDALWGDPRRHGDLWAVHNPYDLAPRLREVGLFVSVGNGQPGPLDGPATNGQLQQIEQALYPQNLAFVERLRELGIPVRFDNYGPGTHNWPYWQRELHRSLPMLLGALQRPAAAPTSPTPQHSTPPHPGDQADGSERLLAAVRVVLVAALTALVLAISLGWQTLARENRQLMRRPALTRHRNRGASSGGQGQASPVVKLVVVALCLLWLIPTLGIVITSFRTPDAVNSSGWWTVFIPPFDLDQLSAASYRQAWSGGMGSSFLNSLAVTLPAVAIPVVIAGPAAYAFAFLRFRGREALLALIVGLLIVPNQVALAPLLRFYGSVGLIGEYAAVYLTHIGFNLPLGVFIFWTYMRTLPVAVLESARVDGASHYQIFWRLVIPLSVPALAAYAVFQFLWVWNDLLIALLYLGEGDRQVVTVTLGGVIGGNQLLGWQVVTGAAIITMAVPVLVFVTLQRYFVRGLTAGSVGG
jgi:ABC-type glycerol-3-phosphate transport system permease component/S-formylglutathione hydrolase FrmB